MAKTLAEIIKSFPETFGLRAFPGKTFRISTFSSYVNDDGVPMLYTEIHDTRVAGQWSSFAKGTEEELRANIVLKLHPEPIRDEETRRAQQRETLAYQAKCLTHYAKRLADIAKTGTVKVGRGQPMLYSFDSDSGLQAINSYADGAATVVADLRSSFPRKAR